MRIWLAVAGGAIFLFALACLCGLMLRWRRCTTTFPTRRLTDEEVER